ncbi:MAG: methyltransferase domain-containing protein [Clostridiales bacterium]|nr:methyltransferase domain-containing protein [Clostridiales bacterium]
MNLPPSFVTRMQRLLREEYPAYEKALQESPVKGLITSVKMSAEAFAAQQPFALKEIPYCTNGFYFNAPNPGRHPLHHAGGFYVQDPSAMATVCALPVQKGLRVLDCCAAPGGKSIQLATKIGPDGLLLSNEIDRGRARILAANIERMGLTNTIVTSQDTAALKEQYPDYFDLVLADAPCSGEGMFRKYEEAVSDWSEGKIAGCTNMQQNILENASACVMPGGYLLYATCTFSVEENEAMIEAFLENHPQFTLCPVNEALLPFTKPGVTEKTILTRRFYPHQAPGEGQFIALMQKSADSDRQKQPPARKSTFCQPTKEEQALIHQFIAQNTTLDLTHHPIITAPDGFRILSSPAPASLQSIVAYGVNMGHIQKGVFHPHHQFFSAYGRFFKQQVNLAADSSEAALFLAGHPLPFAGPNGWCCILIDGCPLSGGKRVGGLVKNHYPKGLRQSLPS